MNITEHEMRGLLTGECIPGDIRVNEDLAAYLARRFSEQQKKLAAANKELARYSMSAGQADQFAAEAKAVRKALGYAENAEDVAPVDLLEKIAGLRAEAIDEFGRYHNFSGKLLIQEEAKKYAEKLRAETNTTPSQYESLAGGK